MYNAASIHYAATRSYSTSPWWNYNTGSAWYGSTYHDHYYNNPSYYNYDDYAKIIYRFDNGESIALTLYQPVESVEQAKGWILVRVNGKDNFFFPGTKPGFIFQNKTHSVTLKYGAFIEDWGW